VTVAAYAVARRWARDPRFSFGTGKVNALGGFTGAVLLAGFAVVMAGESLNRFFNPIEIRFNEAIGVAVLGLLVNGVSVWILHGGQDPSHDHDHVRDHNLRAAFLHVLADALTSLLAIAALLAAKLWGLNWMDPAMGIIGSILVARWSWGLLRDTSAVLLDRQAPAEAVGRCRAALDALGAERTLDLHVWSIGPGLWAVAATVESVEPISGAALEDDLRTIGVVHCTVESRAIGDGR
jgi:cation diffusion facilitator family transporter